MVLQAELVVVERRVLDFELRAFGVSLLIPLFATRKEFNDRGNVSRSTV